MNLPTLNISFADSEGEEWLIAITLPKGLGVPAVGDVYVGKGITGTVETRTWDDGGVDLRLKLEDDVDFQRVLTGEVPPESVGLPADFMQP